MGRSAPAQAKGEKVAKAIATGLHIILTFQAKLSYLAEECS